MNKFAIAFLAIVAVATAAVLPAHSAGSDAGAETLRNDQVVNAEDFNYSYETSNGIKAQEAGQLKQIGKESGIATQGEFSYTGPDGQQYKVTFVADENGFQPQGSHLPVVQ